MHAERLKKCIADGQVADCTMNDIYYTVLTLASAPFLDIPLLENVAGLSPDRIDLFLASRRDDMVRILQARFMPR